MEEVIKKAIEGGYREDIVQIHKNMCSCGGDLNFGFNDCLAQINTSLIADEVLKVVVEKIRKYYEKFEDTDLNIFESTVLYQTREDILELLSNLSTNKENKNNG